MRQSAIGNSPKELITLKIFTQIGHSFWLMQSHWKDIIYKILEPEAKRGQRSAQYMTSNQPITKRPKCIHQFMQYQKGNEIIDKNTQTHRRIQAPPNGYMLFGRVMGFGFRVSVFHRKSAKNTMNIIIVMWRRHMFSVHIIQCIPRKKRREEKMTTWKRNKTTNKYWNIPFGHSQRNICSIRL